MTNQELYNKLVSRRIIPQQFTIKQLFMAAPIGDRIIGAEFKFGIWDTEYHIINGVKSFKNIELTYVTKSRII